MSETQSSADPSIASAYRRDLTAPFPWFGGKSRAAVEVWARFGDTPNYVEPFAGSLAVLLGRPKPAGPRVETVNDLDGFLVNFWRAVRDTPDEVAEHADWPVSEIDLHARHASLVARRAEITNRLHADPDWSDPKVAGWWVWGVCSWIGSGWCSGRGPWQVVDGEFVDTRSTDGEGVWRQIPNLGNNGTGINRQLPRLGNSGQGVHRPTVPSPALAWMRDLSARLRRVRVAAGDWQRVVADSVTTRHGVTGILLDPPYGDDHGDYYSTDSRTVAGDVLAWALANGDRPDLRIAYCGYTQDGPGPLDEAGWSVHRWSTKGGYGNGKGNAAETNRRREAIWFSPGCLSSESLLDLL